MLSLGDLLSEAPAIKARTLVVCGAEDVTTTSATCRELAQSIPNGRFLEVPAAAHALYVDAPEAFWSALANHFTEAT